MLIVTFWPLTAEFGEMAISEVKSPITTVFDVTDIDFAVAVVSTARALNDTVPVELAVYFHVIVASSPARPDADRLSDDSL
jgi:hypothetical protein